MITDHYHYHKDNNVKFDIQYIIYMNKNVGMTQKALSYIQNRPHNDYPHHRFIFWFFSGFSKPVARGYGRYT